MTRDPEAADPRRWYRSTGVVVAGCLVAYLVLSSLIFWPAAPWNDVRLPSVPWGGFGYGDPAQMAWYLAWTPYALLHGLNPLHTTFIDYPTGANLASNNTPAPLLGLLAAPVSLTLGPVAAFNVLLRLAFASSAASMFLVLRNWCRSSISFVGGLFYGFGPYVVAQVTHLNLDFVPLLPAIVWAIVDLVGTHRHRPRTMGLLLGVFVGAQFLIDPELLVLLGSVVVPGLLVVAWRERDHLRQGLGALARALPYAALVAVAIGGFYGWTMFFGAGHAHGPTLPVPRLQLLRSDLLSAAVPTLNQMVLPKSLVTVASRFVNGNFAENDGYLGLGLIAWVLIVSVRYRARRVVRYAALGALAAWVLSLGSRLTINAHATAIPLPEAIFARIPLLDRIVPSRYAVVVALFAVIAGAVGAEQFVRSLRDRGSGLHLDDVAMVSVALLAVVLAFPQVALVTRPPNWPSSVQSALRAIPRGAVVLTYPYPLVVNTESESWQAQDSFQFKLIGGYVNIPGRAYFSHEFANPLRPTAVETYLVDSLGNEPDPYPPISPGTDMRADLCDFVRRNGVGAIVYWSQGLRPRRVLHLVEADFGAPTASVARGTFDVWRVTAARCG